MSVISYDPQSIQGYGAFALPEVEGQFNFFIAENLVLDLLTIPSFVENGRAIVNGYITPVFRVRSGLDSLSFTTTPDARWKLGTFGYGAGAIITINPVTNEISAEAIPASPEFLIYPLQKLQTSRFSMYFPNPSIVDYAVDFDPNQNPNLDAWVLNSRRNSSNSPSFQLASHVFFNVVPGIVADFKLYYTFEATLLDFFADTRDVQNILI